MISTFMLLSIFGGISVWVIGQSLPTLLKHKNPIRHFFLMFRAIFNIAPKKVSIRLMIMLTFNLVIFIMLMCNSTYVDLNFFLKLPGVFFILGYETILLSLCISVFVTRKEKEENWMMIRMKAHRCIYGDYPKANEYGNLFDRN